MKGADLYSSGLGVRFTPKLMVKYVLLSLGVVGLLVFGSGVASQSSGPASQQERFVVRVPEDFPTIQAAIDAVAEGGTVLIGPGTYREHLKISKSLRLRGASQESVQIQAVDHRSVTIDIDSEKPIQVSLEDFTVKNKGFLLSSGIRVGGDVQALIERITVSGYEDGDGIRLSNSMSVILSMVTISRNRTGITIENAFSLEDINALIQDATITDNVEGISVYLWSGHLVVRRSLLAWNRRVAFKLLGGWLGGLVATLEENKITQNMSGIHLGFDRDPILTLAFLTSQNQPEPGPRVIIMYKNQIIGNLLYGIALLRGECPETGESLLKDDDPLTTRHGNAFIGSENEIRDNGKGDLCPSDFHWPPGFRK